MNILWLQKLKIHAVHFLEQWDLRNLGAVKNWTTAEKIFAKLIWTTIIFLQVYYEIKFFQTIKHLQTIFENLVA